MYTPRTSSYIDNAWPLLRDFGYSREEIAQVVLDSDYDDQLINERIANMALDGADGKGWKKVGKQQQTTPPKRNRRPPPNSHRQPRTDGARPEATRPPLEAARGRVEEGAARPELAGRVDAAARVDGSRVEAPRSARTNAGAAVGRVDAGRADAERARGDGLRTRPPAAKPAWDVTENQPPPAEERPEKHESAYKVAPPPPSISNRATTWASKLKTNVHKPMEGGSDSAARAKQGPTAHEGGAVPETKSDAPPPAPKSTANSWAARLRGIKPDQPETVVKPAVSEPAAEEQESPETAVAAKQPAPAHLAEASPEQLTVQSRDSQGGSLPPEPEGSASPADLGEPAVSTTKVQAATSAPPAEQTGGVLRGEPPQDLPAPPPPQHHGLQQQLQPQHQQQPPHPQQPPQLQQQQHHHHHPQPHQYSEYQSMHLHQQVSQQPTALPRTYEHYNAPPPYQYQQHPYPGTYRMTNYMDYDYGRARGAAHTGPQATSAYPEYYLGYPPRLAATGPSGEETGAFADLSGYGAGPSGGEPTYPYYYAPYEHQRRQQLEFMAQEPVTAAAGGPPGQAGAREYARDYAREAPVPPYPGQSASYGRPDLFRRDAYHQPPVYMASAQEASAPSVAQPPYQQAYHRYAYNGAGYYTPFGATAATASTDHRRTRY